MTVEYKESRSYGSGLVGDNELVAENELLRREVAQLRQAMQTRSVIDEGRGMVMALGPCTPGDAWDVLVDVSQHTNIKLRAVAAHLTAITTSQAPPGPIQRALTLALQARRPR